MGYTRLNSVGSQIATQSFEIIFEVEEFTDEIYDAFKEAGCADAVFVTRSGEHSAQFDRVAECLPEAVESAITDLQSVDGVKIVRIDFDELMDIHAVTTRIGVDAQALNQLIKSTYNPTFPGPVEWDRNPKTYEWVAVAGWANTHLPARKLKASKEAEFVNALNQTLASNA
jgi:hypothetical protein